MWALVTGEYTVGKVLGIISITWHPPLSLPLCLSGSVSSYPSILIVFCSTLPLPWNAERSQLSPRGFYSLGILWSLSLSPSISISIPMPSIGITVEQYWRSIKKPLSLSLYPSRFLLPFTLFLVHLHIFENLFSMQEKAQKTSLLRADFTAPSGIFYPLLPLLLFFRQSHSKISQAYSVLLLSHSVFQSQCASESLNPVFSEATGVQWVRPKWASQPYKANRG